MKFCLDIPAPLERQLETLPPLVRRGLLGGLHLAAQALGESGGARAWGERVSDFQPPMFVITSRGHRLLYEVDAAHRALRVRSLALPTRADAP